MLVCICCKSINNSVSLFRTQFVLDLLSFFKQFQFHCINLVLKSSINLNHKEGKLEEATIDKSTTISDSWGKNISGEGGGARGGGGDLYREEFPWGYCHGAIVFRVIVRKQ